MKLDAGRIDGFLRDPGRAVLVVLHGPDTGLAAERARLLTRALLGGAADDPFRLDELENPDPGALLEAAYAQALTGGRRVVRVREAGDGLAKAAERLLASPPESLVVLEAGELTPRSKLRALAEKHPNAAAIACYKLDGPRIPKALGDLLRANNVQADSDALSWCAEHLSGEAAELAQAAELLTLYAGTETRISREDVEAALPDGGETSIGEAIDAALTGDLARTDRAISLAYGEGASPVALIRVLLGELARLRLIVAELRPGQSPREAIEALRPPVFFRRVPIVTRAAGLWSLAAIDEALRAALAAEAACKSTHIPDQDYCRHTMLALAGRARAAGRRK
jgi:DNA polymerase III subunit delta